MLIDTNAQYSRHELFEAFQALRRSYYGIDNWLDYEVGGNIDILAYYMNVDLLLGRMLRMMGVTRSTLNDAQKAIMYSIAFSYGHKEEDVYRYFKLSKKTKSRSLFYREKLKVLVLRYPHIHSLYKKIAKTLENDVINRKNERNWLQKPA